METTNAWLVEADVVASDIPDVAPRQTLIVQSYDGTAAGAETWAADVLDFAVVRIRSVRRVYGELVESRADGRLDEVTS